MQLMLVLIPAIIVIYYLVLGVVFTWNISMGFRGQNNLLQNEEDETSARKYTTISTRAGFEPAASLTRSRYPTARANL